MRDENFDNETVSIKLDFQQVQLRDIDRILSLVGENIDPSKKADLLDWKVKFLEATVPEQLKEEIDYPEEFSDDALKKAREEFDKDKITKILSHRSRILFEKIIQIISVNNGWYTRGKEGTF